MNWKGCVGCIKIPKNNDPPNRYNINWAGRVILICCLMIFRKNNAEGELLLLLDGDVGDKNALEFEFELDRIEGEWREVGVGSDSCDRCGDGNCDDEFNLEAARLPFSNKDAGDLQRSLSFSFFLFTIL